MPRKRIALVLVSLPLLGASCSRQKLLPNTNIEDTPLSRGVIEVVERYRKALEARDAAQVLVLVDPTYQDNNGTPEPDDDLDYARIKQVLRDRLQHATRIHYRLEYQRLSTKGREAYVDVWIDATFIYELAGSPPRYSRFTDHHRFVLITADRSWRFIRGL